jgi:hypothetical protein
VAVEGSTTRDVQTTDDVTFSNVPAGSHTVSLRDVAPNCSVTNGASRDDVPVVAGSTTEVEFLVICPAPSPEPGSIEVNVSTSGEEMDDGYTIVLDDTPPGRGIGANEGTSFTDVSAGEHKVDLTDVAGNCSVSDGPSRSVSLAGGETRQVEFAVTCAPAGINNELHAKAQS